MTAPLDHPWNVSVAEAVDIQRRLRDHVIPHPPPGFDPRHAAGADLSMSLGSDLAYAGIVVVDMISFATGEEVGLEAPLRFPYVPGLLTFRELPPILDAWRRLTTRPDVIIFDGAGYAHPRRFGLACHGGVALGVPSIGCAKSLLVGHHGALGGERGATADIVDRGAVIGRAVRTRRGVKPLYISIGHLMDLDTAVDIVLRLCVGYREPETTRRTHQFVNRLRRDAALEPGDGRDATARDAPGAPGIHPGREGQTRCETSGTAETSDLRTAPDIAGQ